MIPWLGLRDPFPPVEFALRDPNGLLAAGADLSPMRLLDAYSQGIFPWYSDGDPVLWWSPDPRMVLFVDELRVTRSLRRVIRSGRFTVTMDTAFRDVMLGCAAPRPGQEGTWITPEILDAYTALFDLGYAHSIEAWSGDELAGGLYGVAIGRMFFGESMFSARSNGSRLALAALARTLAGWGWPLLDAQVDNPHLRLLGARAMARPAFASAIAALVDQPGRVGSWREAVGERPVAWLAARPAG